MYKYLFGSKLYGLTNNKSDEDYLIVFNTNSEKDEYIKNTNNKDEECWTWQEFKSKLESHDLKALEVYYANVGNVGTHLFINCEEYQFRLDLQQLRRAVSAVVSNAHVKAKKKFKDQEVYIGLKSYYHCIRILTMYNYLAKHRTFNPSNFKNELDYVYNDIVVQSQSKNPEDLWFELESKYKYMLKSLQHTFRSYCPKDN